MPVRLLIVLNADDLATANLAGITVLATAPVIEDNLVMWLILFKQHSLLSTFCCPCYLIGASFVYCFPDPSPSN